jgi:hypothetical protein
MPPRVCADAADTYTHYRERERERERESVCFVYWYSFHEPLRRSRYAASAGVSIVMFNMSVSCWISAHKGILTHYQDRSKRPEARPPPCRGQYNPCGLGLSIVRHHSLLNLRAR